MTTAHSWPIASSDSIGTSTGASPPRRGALEVGEHQHRVGGPRHRAVAVRDGAVVALALEGAEHHRPRGARQRLVLDRARQRDQRALAQQLRATALVGARSRRRSTGGRSARPAARARSSAAGTDSPRSR